MSVFHAIHALAQHAVLPDPQGPQPELHEGLADPYGDLPSALYVELHDDDKDYDHYN